VVRRGDGTPLEGAVIEATDAAGSRLRTDSGAEPGAFTVPQLRDGTVVRLRAVAGAASSELVEVPAGRHDAVLVVDVGAWFAVRLDEASVAGSRGRLGPGADTIPVLALPVGVTSEIRPGVTVVLGGLARERTYSVLVGPTATGRFGAAEDVVADGRTVTIGLRDGTPLGGSVVAAEGVGRRGHVQALRDGVVIARTVIEAGGAFRFAGLPPGRWTLRAVGSEGASPGASVDADAGRDDVELDLRVR
jgi:hypothetical protein